MNRIGRLATGTQRLFVDLGRGLILVQRREQCAEYRDRQLGRSGSIARWVASQIPRQTANQTFVPAPNADQPMARDRALPSPVSHWAMATKKAAAIKT